jgi:hypothetical protein
VFFFVSRRNLLELLPPDNWPDDAIFISRRWPNLTAVTCYNSMAKIKPYPAIVPLLVIACFIRQPNDVLWFAPCSSALRRVHPHHCAIALSYLGVLAFLGCHFFADALLIVAGLSQGHNGQNDHDNTER